MSPNEFIDAFIKFYSLDDIAAYRKCSGRALFYKKVLIYILRIKFRMSFPEIAKVFNNHHATILYHYQDISKMKGLDRSVEDAWKIYRS